MKIMLTFLGLFLLMVSFGVARQQQHASELCGFAVQGEPAHRQFKGQMTSCRSYTSSNSLIPQLNLRGPNRNVALRCQ